MKPVHFIATLALVATGAASAAENHGHDVKPLHGGVVVEVKDIEYELIAKPESMQLYLRDHGKPIDVSNVTAKLTSLTGMDKQEAELKPAGDKLEAKGSFKIAANTKVVVLVSQAGKSSTARFVLK